MKYSKTLMALAIFASISACKKDEPEPEPVKVDPPTFVLNNATNVTTSNATISGTVSGEEIQEVGFVYSSKSTLNVSSATKITGNAVGDITTTFTTLSDDKTYYYAAFAKNINDEFFMSETKSFKTDKEIVLGIGDRYEGGIIFSLDRGGKSGLLASPSNITEGTTWQTAYDKCKDYTLQGNADWRLPKISDLEKLYAVKDKVGGFGNIAYWSSSQGSPSTLAYGVFFGTGQYAGKTFPYTKTGTYQYSRAIRNFTSL